MITIFLQGGLGNQLFQLAALETISKQTNNSIFLEDEETPKTHHSQQNYFETIFLEWKHIPRIKLDAKNVNEVSYEFQTWNLPDPVTKLCGYFQNHKYISDEFISRLWLPNVPKLNGAFLHIRGGDYVNNSFHDVGLEEYYERAIQKFPAGTKFYIFTNDIPYAKTLSFLKKIDHEYSTERDEVRALAYMKNCTVGGICANSTFSWWGAYLNRENRILVLPSKWFNDRSIFIDGYFFPNSIQCPV